MQVFKGFIKTHVVRNAHHPALGNPRQSPDVLRKAAAVRIKSRRKTDFLVARTLRKQSPLAIKTRAARNVMKTHDAVAQFPLRNAIADGHNGSGNFMSKNLWGSHKSVLNFFQVGATNPTGRHSN
jgi:hypothetical protein